MKVKYDMATMKLMAMFENMTRVTLKDCFEHGDTLYFLVPQADVHRAVGKAAGTVRKLSSMLNKKVKIIGFSDDLCQFVRNMIMPLKVKEVTEENGIVTIRDEDQRTKGLIIGRNAQNLRALERHVQRHFDIEEIKVV